MHRTKTKSESLIGTCGQFCQKGDFDTCVPHNPKLFEMKEILICKLIFKTHLGICQETYFIVLLF